jgi:DME family drug/metabolite transporter
LSVIFTAPWGLAAIASLTLHDLVGVAYLGVVQLGIAYTLFTVAMARGVRSLDAGIICYTEPVLNPVWVFLVLGERPSGRALLGGAIIIVAVISHMLLDARGKRRANTLAVAAHD